MTIILIIIAIIVIAILIIKALIKLFVNIMRYFICGHRDFILGRMNKQEEETYIKRYSGLTFLEYWFRKR